MIEPSREFLREHEDLLDKLSRVREMPPGRFRVNHAANPFETVLPHLSLARTATRLQALQGVLGLCDGQQDRALEAIFVMLKVSTALRDEPIAVSLNSNRRIQRNIGEMIESMLRVTEVDEQSLEDVQESVSVLLASMTLKWVLWGERAGAIGAQQRR